MAVLPVIAIAVKGDRCGSYFRAPGSASGVHLDFVFWKPCPHYWKGRVPAIFRGEVRDQDLGIVGPLDFLTIMATLALQNEAPWYLRDTSSGLPRGWCKSSSLFKAFYCCIVLFCLSTYIETLENREHLHRSLVYICDALRPMAKGAAPLLFVKTPKESAISSVRGNDYEFLDVGGSELLRSGGYGFLDGAGYFN